jgi:glycerol-3-phosphate dehydrogenase/1-acyl-sn-glycerol-3-phosphate acyltransferase
MGKPDQSEFAAPWQREFFKNIKAFVDQGYSESESKELLSKYLKLSAATPMPAVIDSFQDESRLDDVGVYTEKDPEIRDFMVSFFKPILKNFQLEGLDNLKELKGVLDRFPVTIVSNHLSHFDTAAIYGMLYHAGGLARDLADRMVFIAGRLVFFPDFTRLGLYTVNNLLVCSKKDMADNPAMADLMTRINMRSFRQAQDLQKKGKVIAVFPEGTRSRTGKLLAFVDAVYHYVANKIIVPISLTGTDNILPTESFLFNIAHGSIKIGKPILVGKLPPKDLEELPDHIQRLSIPRDVDKKQFVIDSLALLVGENLQQHMHGTYRNLYESDMRHPKKNNLIKTNDTRAERVVVLGHSRDGMATAAILANKGLPITVYLDNPELAKSFNETGYDEKLFPLFKFPPNIRLTSDVNLLNEATMLIFAFRPWELDQKIPPIKAHLQASKAPILIVTKGFTRSKDGLMSSDLTKMYEIDSGRIITMAGANYPAQVIERKPSGYELAALNTSLLPDLMKLLTTGYSFLRPAINPYDIKGVQLGGALKNVYAIGIGLVDGYYDQKLGGNCDNALFHISNKVFREMASIGVRLGGRRSTFAGLSGLTDLMLGMFGRDSFDRNYGYQLASGKSKKNLEPTAGVYSLEALGKLTKLDPHGTPLAHAIYQIVIKDKNLERTIEKVIRRLSSR